MKKLLFTLPVAPKNITRLDEFLQLLKDKDFDVEIIAGIKHLTEDQLLEKWPGVVAHIASSDKMTARAMQAADQLKIISRAGVGIETIDVPAATERGIAVTNAPGAGAETVAEFTFALIIALSRRLIEAHNSLHAGKWERLHGISLYRKTLGVVGLGNIGKQLIKISSGFDMKPIAFDPYADKQYALENGIELCTLDELLTKSDYVSIHVPYNQHTKNLISERELRMMKPSAQIINTSRGGIVNEEALFTALKENVIFGAALDVYTTEPFTDLSNPLFTLDNLIMTPHAAGSSFEGRNRIIEAAVHNVINYFEGRPLVGLVNPEVLQKS